MGRSKKRLSEVMPDVAKMFRQDLNSVFLHDNVTTPHSLGVSDERRFFWDCDCGLGSAGHVTFKSTKAVTQSLSRKGNVGLHCLVCNPDVTCHPDQCRSQKELILWRALQSATLAASFPGLIWVVEALVVEGSCIPADVWLPGMRLIIQVDEKQHNNEGRHLRQDRDYDDKANSQGLQDRKSVV